MAERNAWLFFCVRVLLIDSLNAIYKLAKEKPLHASIDAQKVLAYRISLEILCMCPLAFQRHKQHFVSHTNSSFDRLS